MNLSFTAPILLSAALLLFSSCRDDFGKRLQQEATDYTKKRCPQRLDAYTTLDSVVYDPDTRIYARYFSLDATTPETLLEHPASIREMLLQELKGDAGWKRCKDEGICFSYSYRSKRNDSLVYTTTLSPDDYRH